MVPTLKTAADYSAMCSPSAGVTRTEAGLVCLLALEYDFAAMCLHSTEAIAVNAADLYELVVFVALSIAFVAHSVDFASIHCLLPLEPVHKTQIEIQTIIISRINWMMDLFAKDTN